ncbi:PAS domain-containing sensor histidine kinase [Rhodopseudomonas palustris]|uniref:histidine kinase n=1 Tax=Rhodopseudomonas palustris (strain BisB18) TaxID=316056 RepID=Q213K3_RHOPB
MLDEIFPGDGELSRLMRSHDWSATPLGPPETWPQGLKIPLRMMLTSRFEMWLGWGPDLAFFYNDAYVPTLGSKHPAALGRPMREVWREVFEAVKDRVRSVMVDNVATWDKALLLLLERNGYPEETYHTFSYSPLRGDTGVTEGLMCVVSEETERVISERRLNTLRALADGLLNTRTAEGVINEIRAAVLLDRKDFPFGLVYLRDHAGGWSGQPCSLDAGALLTVDWPLHGFEGGASARRVPLAPLGLALPCGAWDRPPGDALVLPIAHGSGESFGALVLGLNPYRPHDPDIVGFAQLLAGQISGALANVEALKSEIRRADRIWINSRDLLVVVDADGIFQSVSPSWTRILGYAPDEVVGRSFRHFIHPDDLALATGGLETATQAIDLTAFEIRQLSNTGEVVWVSWNTKLEGRFVYAYGRDITAEKTQAAALLVAEDQLRQSQKMEAIGQLTGGIAHDFNNMLAVVIGSLELLDRKIGDPSAAVRRYIDAAMDGAKRSAALTQRLLAFSRRQPLKPEILDANRLVAETSEILRHSIGGNVRLETVLAGGLWRVHADPNQLASALLNLAVNARDAMDGGGRLTIETQNAHLDDAYAQANFGVCAGQYVMIAMTDTGTGMAPEVIARAFDPFFTTKEVGKGTGLGLSQVYGFIKQSSGHVKIYSEPGEGTTVKIYLPRMFNAIDEFVPRLASTADPAGSFGELILVVEDEPAMRQFSIEALGTLGYRVCEAEGAATALALLDAHPDIALLFTDIIMPDVNGRQLADEACRRRPDLKVLYTTGYTRNAVVHNGVVDPGVQLISKPFTIDQLAEKLREVLDR